MVLRQKVFNSRTKWIHVWMLAGVFRTSTFSSETLEVIYHLSIFHTNFILSNFICLFMHLPKNITQITQSFYNIINKILWRIPAIKKIYVVNFNSSRKNLKTIFQHFKKQLYICYVLIFWLLLGKTFRQTESFISPYLK